MLPTEIRKQAQQAHEQFQRDPFYPGLHFEEVDKFGICGPHGSHAATVSSASAGMERSPGFGLGRTASTRGSLRDARGREVKAAYWTPRRMTSQFFSSAVATFWPRVRPESTSYTLPSVTPSTTPLSTHLPFCKVST